MSRFNEIQQSFSTWPDPLLSVALLVAAAFIVAIALQPGKPLLKAIVLAYVIFP